MYRNEVAGLKEQRKQIEKSIEIGELPECEKYSSLMNEKKHIVDTIKMIDYRAETAMATMIQPATITEEDNKSLVATDIFDRSRP